MRTSVAVEDKLTRLRFFLKDLGPTLVAFSGGVDSSFLLAVASEVLRKNVTALMTLSSSTPSEDAAQAASLARELNVDFLTINHDELGIPQYAANPVNRCYFCKNSLYEICTREAARLSISSIVDGVNLDDLKDYRPGLQAASEYQVIHPLVETQFTKEDIRRASKLLGLSTWERPASPCLSSRIPYGTPISATMLTQISQGEKLFHSLGLKELRVRHHQTYARIELNLHDLINLTSISPIDRIEGDLKKIGFPSVVFDLEGYRSGVFNTAKK
ncbi:MAG: ATP-dependent sacrificial sulfur transferase LarE [Candidatus Binatia bacterium]